MATINFIFDNFYNGIPIPNGISVEDWLKYAPTESLAYYMYLKPQTAKKLYFDVFNILFTN